MDTIKEILEILGYDTADELEIGQHISLEREGFMDLTVEKIGEYNISVAHYYEQRGDLMRDPEIVFNTAGDGWTPIEYRHDPLQNDYDESGLDIDGFDQQWSENLRKQGFVDAAKQRAGDDQ